MKRLGLHAGLLAVFLAFPVPAQAKQSREFCGRPKASPAALLDQVKRDKAMRPVSESKQFVSYSDAGGQHIWTFTRPGHPAHPSAVCRQMTMKGAAVEIDMQLQCGAAQAVCGKLKKELEQINELMKAQKQAVR